MEIVQFTPKQHGDFVATPTADCIIALVEHCQTWGDMGLIVGDPGVGKSVALRHYAETRERVHYVELRHQHSRALGPALQGLCEGFGLWHCQHAAVQASAGRLRNWLCDLSEPVDGRRHVLLIDESQFLSDDCLDLLRCAWDEAQVGMVFAGNGSFRRGFARGQKTTLAPFASRLGPRLDLGLPSAADVAAICRSRDVQGAREVAFLQHYANDGGLRMVAKIIDTAVRRFPGEAVRLPQLEAAVAFLGV